MKRPSVKVFGRRVRMTAGGIYPAEYQLFLDTSFRSPEERGYSSLVGSAV